MALFLFNRLQSQSPVPLLAGYLGGEQLVLEVPETNDDWFINGFSISQKDGFGLLDSPIHVRRRGGGGGPQ